MSTSSANLPSEAASASVAQPRTTWSLAAEPLTRGSVGLQAVLRGALLGDGPAAARRRLLLLVLLPALVWCPTLGFDFVLDDAGTFLEDPLAQGPLNLPAIFGSTVHVERSTLPYYRPGITFTYWLDRTLWESNPAGFHLTNLAWHVLNVLLAYALIRRAGVGPGLGLAAAALFGVLPSHAEAVAWVQGRVDLAASAFLLAAATCALLLRERPTPLRWAGALLAFALALLAKETAVALPGLLVLLWRVKGTEPWRATARRLAPFLATLIAYVGLRRAVLSAATGFALAYDRLPARALGLMALLVEYVRIAVWPGLLPNFHMAVAPNGSVSPAQAGMGLAIALGLLLVTIVGRTAAYTHRRSWMPAVAGAGWFLLALAPALGVVALQNAPAVGFLVTERYVYLPALGLCVMAAFWVGRLSPRSGWAPGAMTLLLIVASGGALARAQSWRDAETMYRAILPRTADRALAHGNLGTLYLERGETQAAIAEFDAVLREDPTQPAALNNLGVARARQGRTDEALALYREALQRKPRYAMAWNNLGVLMEERGEWAEARAAYQKALAIDPTLVQARRNLEELGTGAPGERGDGR